ncbi:hypothetical protein LCGC14_2912270, partial [marine sediment metagenome]
PGSAYKVWIAMLIRILYDLQFFQLVNYIGYSRSRSARYGRDPGA